MVVERVMERLAPLVEEFRALGEHQLSEATRRALVDLERLRDGLMLAEPAAEAIG